MRLYILIHMHSIGSTLQPPTYKDQLLSLEFSLNFFPFLSPPNEIKITANCITSWETENGFLEFQYFFQRRKELCESSCPEILLK